jgi:hypothetical protein
MGNDGAGKAKHGTSFIYKTVWTTRNFLHFGCTFVLWFDKINCSRKHWGQVASTSALFSLLPESLLGGGDYFLCGTYTGWIFPKDKKFNDSC